MATHSSILAWETPWTEEPGGLQSMGLQSIRHGFETKLLLLLGPQEVSSRRDNTQRIKPKSQQQAWRQKLSLWPGPSCYVMVSSSSLGKKATSGRKVSVRRMALAGSVPS